MTASTICLITGANQGLGLGLSRKLASENPGWLVLMGSRSPEKGSKAADELKKDGLNVEPITIDVTDDQSIDQAANEVKSKYGRLDVLINNAGIAPNELADDNASLRKIYHQIYDTNAIGSAIVTHAFESLLAKATSLPPRIVFSSSSLGSVTYKSDPKNLFQPVPAPGYRSSKSAMNMIMAHYAGKHREDGWKVNAICPGYIGTNMNDMNGPGTIEEGIVQLAKMATLDQDGPTSTWTDKEGSIPF
jgi:NAD(P)-dependent dehydrogenase (short-subunit alcohol dehydrogenase family)